MVKLFGSVKWSGELTVAKKIKHPDERKIKKYQRESPNFDPQSYRRAFYRVGKQLQENKGGHSTRTKN